MKQIHIDNYIGVYDNVVDENYCQQVIRRFEDIEDTSGFAYQDGKKQFQNGSLGRRDNSLFFCQVSKDFAKDIQGKVIDCFNQYKQEYVGLDGMGLASFTCKVQRTGSSGGYHVWHSEHAGDPGSMRRAAVWILYLTSHEDSGETEFLQQGIRVKPQAGRVVIWPASFTHPHRGNPVYDSVKYIATGWFEHYYDIAKEVENG